MVKSLCSGKVCIWRESVIFMRVPRVRSRKFRWRWLGNLPAMWILLFCCRNCKNNTKINRKKGGEGGGGATPRPSSKSAHGPDGVLQSCHPYGYSTASCISCILSIPNLDSIFSPFPAPRCSPFKCLSLWLLNPQSLPSNEASPGSQKTY